MLAIIRKDLSEQSLLLAPGCLLALAGLVVLTSRGPVQADAMLRAFDAFVLLCAAPLALLLVRQLVVVEYVRRGFDALEPLPVSQAGVLAGKALVGLALLAGVALAGATMTASALRLVTDQPPAPAALAARAFAFLLAVHGLAFLAATTGRHRHTVVLAAAAALGLAARLGLADLERLGPARLARGGFYAADGPFDPPAVEAAALGLGALALGFVLGCARRGRLAHAWSGRWFQPTRRALTTGRRRRRRFDRAWTRRPPVTLEGAAEVQGADQACASPRPIGPRARPRWRRWPRRSATSPPALRRIQRRRRGWRTGPGLPPATTQRLDTGGARGLLVRTPSPTRPGTRGVRRLPPRVRAGHDAAPGAARDSRCGARSGPRRGSRRR
ncbi:MAG: hypothetical protein KF878_07950 [Planctomycetes bacterium]|nr:hypothetical protein [Planctomycetota bacterium]